MSDIFIGLIDERASAIFSFYNNYANYAEQRLLDGVDSDEGDQSEFDDFNELIKLYHSELQSSIGYIAISTGYLDPEEGSPDSGFWWENAIITNSSSQLFYTNITATSYYYRINNKTEPYARHPYLYWNQYHVDLGSFDNFAWKNSSSRSSYTDTQNPFATGTNFRMAEPLEHWGDSSNLLWGRIVYDGRWAYRNRYINDTSYSSHAYTGFYDYETPTRSLTNLVGSDIDPTPWSIMRDTRWGSGANDLPLLLVTHTIQNHSGTTTGTFDIPLTESPSLGSLYYNVYNDDTNQIFTFEITGSITTGSVERYSYINGTPSITSSDLNSSSMRFQSDYSITNHTGGSSGTFRISGDPTISTGWYLVCTTNSSYGFVLEITNVTDVPNPFPPPTNLYTEYDYENAIWPTPNSGELNNDHVFFIRLPSIPEGIKTGSYIDGRSHVWTYIYNNYYAAFKSRIDDITSLTSTISTKLDDIINFDYSLIADDDVAGSPLFQTETQNFQNTFNNWASAWQLLYGGAPASYSIFDTKWSNSNLDALIDDGTGGIKQLVDFSPNYTGSRTGILSDRVTQIYDDIIGEYELGTNEQWNPTQQQASENNTGQFTLGTLNSYRHNVASKRLNKEDGILTQALQAWYTWNTKINTEIPNLENQLDTFITNREYDIIPEGLVTTTDVDDQIELEWESVKAASSYTIEYKEGISGAWNTIIETYGYVEPGPDGYPDGVPEFDNNPPSAFTHQAYTIGQQAITSNTATSTKDTPTGLNDDFTVYDFQIAIDGGPAQNIELRGLDAITWGSLATAISNYFDENDIAATAEIADSDPVSINILSESVGIGSSILMSDGLTNSLFALTDISPSASIDGTTVLEQGKAYYYRVKTNNGYNVTLGDGDIYDKDWDSHSLWSTDGPGVAEDKRLNGEVGLITWPSPTNFLASGIEQDNGIAPSEQHVRLEWDSDPNADTYRVYRATAVNGGLSLIGNTASNFYEDTTAIPGFIYYYTIQSIASSDHLIYDVADILSVPVVSEQTEPLQGKRLWQTIALEATTQDKKEVTLNWTPLSGATGYIVYKSNVESGPFRPITEDDATDRIIIGTTYIDDEPAKQFVDTNYNSPTDGISDSDYIANHRYYFIVVATSPAGLPTVKQYFITSPASGLWSIQDIVNAISQKLLDPDVVICEIVPMENLEDNTVYKIRFSTRNESEQARIEIIDGTFGDSLLPLLGGMQAAQSGGSAYPGVNSYYRVQAVEIVAGSQVRASEFSNVATGTRPII